MGWNPLRGDAIDMGSKRTTGERQAKSKAARPLGQDRPIVPIEAAAAGQIVEIGGSRYYGIRRSLRAIWPQAGDVIDHYRWAVLGTGQADAGGLDGGIAEICRTDPKRVVYLDIETCGFSGTMIFLIGWCWFDGHDDFIIEQALARDYSEEAGILAAIGDRLNSVRVLTTYNGKRFDFPAIYERGVINDVAITSPEIHLDLLDHARRKWKKTLPNCKLQTIETLVCKRYRTGDIPGAQIPDVYHEFVRTGDARKIAMVIQHNLLDVLTLAEIAAHLAAGTEGGD